MEIWKLPGPSRYLGTVERSLRSGASVVLRFPGDVPTGFRVALHALLGDYWQWATIESDAVIESAGGGFVLRRLCERFAPQLSAVARVTAADLCEEDEFRRRLIWVDGLHSGNCGGWLSFLTAYAQASRAVPTLERTRFVALVDGAPSTRVTGDICLAVHDWRNVVDEMDLLFLADARLRDRGVTRKERLLLATAVARVAAWDCVVAAALGEEVAEVILDPRDALRALARERGWTSETPLDWRIGTESGSGSMHPALAAVKEPREIERRVWSAQAAVLLPEIESVRLDIVREHRFQIADNLRRTGEGTDPEEMEIGDLVRVFGRPGFDRQAGWRVRHLRDIRNALAHCEPLSAVRALDLVRHR